MSLQYEAANPESLAAAFDHMAATAENLTGLATTIKQREVRLAEARTWRDAARMVRATTFKGWVPEGAGK